MDEGDWLEKGITVRAVVGLLSDTERFTQDQFFGHRGKPIRELAAAAYYCLAILQRSADQVVLRICKSDPPDVEIELPGRVESLEIVTLVAEGVRPHAEAKNLEKLCRAVARARTLESKVEIVKRDFLGPLEIETSDEDREKTREQWEQMGVPVKVHSPETRRAEQLQVVEAARRQLLAKVDKYAGQGTSFGLLVHSLMASRLPQTDPEIWKDWLSEEQRQAAEIFPDIYVVKSNSIDHEVLVLRKAGTWLEPAGHHFYKDPVAEDRFRSQIDRFDQPGARERRQDVEIQDQA
jgi:hypothetical protein